MTKRLGRGLADIIDTATPGGASVVMLRPEQIRSGRFQPRAVIGESGLEELKASIKRTGLIEPLVVRPVSHGMYELVAGERRLRAAQALGMPEVPVLVKTLSDQEAVEVSIVENAQRENLNPIEEARGYARLLEEFGYTQEDAAAAVGKNRATIANTLRLLTLPEEIRTGLSDGVLTMGHAKALLSVEGRDRQIELYQRVARDGLSVRQTEALVQTWVPGKRRRARRIDPHLQDLEDRLRRVLGTKVSLSSRKKGGRILIEYFSQEDLARILQLLGVTVDREPRPDGRGEP
ncbi:MAG: ParB/RepB/Spo0J family partition protein [Candidatus Omnitrophica bacterium]|nr:ParB/RepB/Spo0J family partition protein [Candidatus Omnitrophota bacterium]